MATNEVHIWLVRIGRPRRCEISDLALLSPSEYERVRAMAAEPASQFVAGRALLRRLLAAYLRRSPTSLKIAHGQHGKPFLENTGPETDFHFNLSHSAGCAAVAIARMPLGIDIESLRDLSDPDAVAARLFMPRELRALRRAPAAQRRRVFFAHWTCKEAYVKATGGGIAHGLASFAVEISTDDQPTLIRSDGTPDPGWTLKQLALGSKLVGAVAVHSPVCTIRCWHLDSPQGAWRSGTGDSGAGKLECPTVGDND